MRGRFEIIDSAHRLRRGKRFASLERAERELSLAVPPGRFYIVDRLTRERV